MKRPAAHSFQIAPEHQPAARVIGLDGEAVFTHPDIKPWRSIGDRENCTLDFESPGDGKRLRWHVKRYAPAQGMTPAEREVKGIQLLSAKKIPAPPLVAWGVLPDRRSFVIVEDLAGYRPADKLMEESAFPFSHLLSSTADLAAKLHRAGLHHRDLYLCHFFVRADSSAVRDVRLIDVARVRPLPKLFFRNRWIVKDLSQFWYSARQFPITEAQRAEWFARYAAGVGIDLSISRLRTNIDRKIARIARHDLRLRKAQPTRNISIPV